MWLKSFGLGILQGWLWLFFLNGPLLYNSSFGYENRPETIFMAFLLLTSITFLLIATMSKRLPLLKNRLLFLILSVAVMIGGTLLVGLPEQDPSFIGRILVFAGTIISGSGSALLVSFWGQRYSKLPANQASLAFGAAVTLGTVIFFTFGRIPLTAAIVSTALLPAFSLLLLIRDIRTAAPVDDTVRVYRPDSFPFPGRLVVFIVLFYLAGGLMYKMIAAGQQFGSYETFWLTNIVYFAVCLMAGIVIYINPDLDLRLLYQPILPLLGAGFVLFPFLHRSYLVIPFSLFQAGFALFDLYTWILFAYLAARFNYSLSVIGWGMFLITSAIFTGELMFTSIFSKITVTVQETELISVLAALLMFTGTMVFKGRRETFAGWDANKTLGNDAVNAEMACASTSGLNNSRPKEEFQAAPLPDYRQPGLFQMFQENLPENFAQQYNLTPREKQILMLLVEGRNNPYIRENLNISNNTLKTHLRNIFSKLSINGRQELLDLFNAFKENFLKDKTPQH